MKRVIIVFVTVLVVAALAVAQAPAGQQPTTPAQKPGAPPAQAQPGQAQPGQSQAAQPVTGGKPQPQPKSPEEYKAFTEANGKAANAAEMEAAANDFATKFPQSELRSLLYLQAMRSYQQSDNAEKTVEMGRKVLQFDATNPEALVTVATVLGERTRDTDLDRDERLNEATKDANLALQSVETGLTIPPNTPPERIEMVKKVLRSMAYGALGTIEMTKKNYPAAEQNLKKSSELNTVQPDPVTYLRLAVVLDQEANALAQQKKSPEAQAKYQEALDAANKAVQYSPADSQVANLSKQERDRLAKLTGAPAATPAPGAAAAPGATPAPAAATPQPKPQTPPPGPQTKPPGR